MAKGTNTEDAYREIRKFILPKRGDWRYRQPRDVFLRTDVGTYQIGGPLLVDQWGYYEDFGDGFGGDDVGGDVPFWEEELGELIGSVRGAGRGDYLPLDKGDIMYIFERTEPVSRRAGHPGLPLGKLITVTLRDMSDHVVPPRVEVDLTSPTWVRELVDRNLRHSGG
jgi:hypothetical protein